MVRKKLHRVGFGTCFLFLFFTLQCLVLPCKAQNAFDILDGKQKVVIPFDYVHNFIILEVKMFGLLPMRFIFDTGAEHTILFKREYADVLNIRYERRIPIVGSDQSRELFAMVARNVSLQIIGLSPRDRDILILEQNFFQLDEITGTNIDGIIGGSYFKNVVVHIDYRKQRLTLCKEKSWGPPKKGFKQIEIRVKSNKPYLDAITFLQDNTRLELDLLIDTGAGLPLLLHNNTHESLDLPDTHITGKLGMGLGGYVVGYIGRIKSLRIKSLEFDQVLTSFQDVSESIINDETRYRNGIIGNQLLSRFEIYIDYINEFAYFKPRRKYNRKFRMDLSGLVIFAIGKDLNEYIVQDIIPRSPAAEADIRVGDVIEKINGFPARFFSLDAITRKLQRRPGKKIRLRILRKGEKLKKEFILRELI